MTTNHYLTLDVRPDASSDEIHRAHRVLAMRFHPDRNSAPEAVSRMASINEAYEVLGHPARPRDYDAILRRPPVGAGIANSILDAARETILRGGWKVLEDDRTSLVLEKEGQRLRTIFVARLSRAAHVRIQQQYRDRTIVLAVEIENPMVAGAQDSVVDLMRSRRLGSAFNGPGDAAVKSLLAPFL